MSAPILPLNEMSVEEKLQTMEALWQSLSADPAAIESPAWLEEELAERERKIEYIFCAVFFAGSSCLFFSRWPIISKQDAKCSS